MKEELTKLLQKHVAHITFTKKDGSERVMKATLRSDLLPEYEKKSDRVKAPNDDILSVYDLEADGWRSIIIKNIIVVSPDFEKGKPQ